MFRHILFPVDGAAPSQTALAPCMAFARDAGARLTLLHVIAPFRVLTVSGAMLEETPDSYRLHSQEAARKLLEPLAAAAREQGVECATLGVEHAHPYEAIIETARQQRCDLIAMASHGRRGVQALLLGSETHKVLTHSAIPVLVYR